MKFKNFKRQKLMLCKMAWMREYCGISDGRDIPKGGGSYIKEHNHGGEVVNFKQLGKYYYGYVEPPGRRSIDDNKPTHLNIEKHFEVPKGVHKTDGITVIWAAPNPYGDGALVVGWYKNATVFHEAQETKKRDDWPYYQIRALVADCHLISEGERNVKLPETFRRTLMYGDAGLLTTEDGKQFLQQLDTLLSKNSRNTPNKKSTRTGRSGRQLDVEKRQAIEQAAVNRVRAHYETSGWRVVSVESENVGWDLTVDNGDDELHVEVKGHQGDRIHCELTPNEYKQAKRKNHAYYLAVVTNALEKPCLRIFQPTQKSKPLKWERVYSNNKSVKVKTTEQIGAIISEN